MSRPHTLRIALLLALASALDAHNGPPFPIIENQRAGPCVVALWTHPDVGTGTFWVMLDPPPGGKVPKDLKVEIGVQPVSGRLPEKRYPARLDSNRGQVEYYAEIPFDAQEMWRIHLFLSSAEGNGETSATVMVTPPGFGRWDLLWYVSPFAAVAFLWIRAIGKRKRRAAR
jgi:hypothetical protein